MRRFKDQQINNNIITQIVYLPHEEDPDLPDLPLPLPLLPDLPEELELDPHQPGEPISCKDNNKMP